MELFGTGTENLANKFSVPVPVPVPKSSIVLLRTWYTYFCRFLSIYIFLHIFEDVVYIFLHIFEDMVYIFLHIFEDMVYIFLHIFEDANQRKRRI